MAFPSCQLACLIKPSGFKVLVLTVHTVLVQRLFDQPGQMFSLKPLLERPSFPCFLDQQVLDLGQVLKAESTIVDAFLVHLSSSHLYPFGGPLEGAQTSAFLTRWKQHNALKPLRKPTGQLI